MRPMQPSPYADDPPYAGYESEAQLRANRRELDLMREYAQMLEYTETREDCGRLYEEMVGYDCAAEDPSASVEDLRDMCRDYIKEWAFSVGVHCEDVLNPTVSDESRSYGPWGGA